MSGKGTRNAKSSGGEIASLPDDATPEPEAPVVHCKKKHWIGIKVVDEDGTVVKDVTVRLKTSDGQVLDVHLGSVHLKKGEYRTSKVLAPGDCEVTFPGVLDAEWRPK